MASAKNSSTRKKCTPIEVNGVLHKSLRDAFHAVEGSVSISYSTFCQRLRSGMPPNQALHQIATHEDKGGTVYLITNIANGRRYVGATSLSIERRLEKHIADSKARSLVSPDSLGAAIVEFGKAYFKIESLSTEGCGRTLGKSEDDWINKLSTRHPNGYNLSSGGAIGGPLGTQTKLDGKTFASKQDACEYLARKHNITTTAAHIRLWKGTPDKPPQTKLNMNIARSIRVAKLNGDRAADLAVKHGVSLSCIKHIIANRVWKD